MQASLSRVHLSVLAPLHHPYGPCRPPSKGCGNEAKTVRVVVYISYKRRGPRICEEVVDEYHYEHTAVRNVPGIRVVLDC